MAMEPIVFTFASMLWMAMSFFSTFLIHITLNSTLWIIGNDSYIVHSDDGNATKYPSLGLYISCMFVEGEEQCSSFAMDGLATDPTLFPTLWKIAYIFYTVGFYALVATSVVSLFTCYFQVICGKNLYNIIGCLQALAGLLLLNSLIFYMSGWGSNIVVNMCGSKAGPFVVDTCKLGPAFYYSILGVILTFASACISSLADRSTSSYRVTKRINKGKKFICLC